MGVLAERKSSFLPTTLESFYGVGEGVGKTPSESLEETRSGIRPTVLFHNM